MKTIPAILTVLIASVLLLGCIGGGDGGDGGGNGGTGGTAPNFVLSITIPRTSYAVGEQISGQYVAENTGLGLFETYILKTCEKEGYEKKCWSSGMSNLGKSSTALKACEITGTGSSCTLNSFSSPGTYTFKLAVYDCAEVEETFGVGCSQADWEDVAAQISPLSSTQKVVTVT